ncbi:MAG: Ig-like domain-containing protein, partial [Gemmatimonadaceae bacterium]
MLLSFLLALHVQTPQMPTIPASPVVRISVTPAARSVAMGDSVKLTVQALDAGGQRVPNVKLLYNAVGSAGTVDTSGMVVGGSMGKMSVTITAIVPGYKPKIERFPMSVVPGPAARVVVSPRPTKLVAGQRLHVEASAFAKSNDERSDPIAWSSSAPAVVSVDRDGLLLAVAPGKATITANAGAARAAMPIEVIANTIATVEITPDHPRARTGDVVRFKAIAKDRAGRAVDGLIPSWTFAPGKGVIEADGAFVAYDPGEYFVTASFGPASNAAVFKVEPRDVRRQVTIVARVARTAFLTSEVWIHPNGNVAYLGTHGGGDRVYAIDISNPAAPVIVDSIQANTRLV